MRKWICYCSVAGVLATGSFLSMAYYAGCCPNSVVGRTMQVIAEASLVMQPLSGLTALAARANLAGSQGNETSPPIDEAIPEDPQPVAPEPAQEPEGGIKQEPPAAERELQPLPPIHRAQVLNQESPVSDKDFEEAAPIVITEDEPMPREEAAPALPAPIEVAGLQGKEIPSKDCPIVMPYCRDDDDEETPPKMPRADAGEETEHTVFKAWMELFEESKEDKEEQSPAAEHLPPPTPIEEDPQADPKCQEDSHLHEHYPGCPRTTCPYSSRNRIEKYDRRPWDFDPKDFGPKEKKKGSEESSEEPYHPGKKLPGDKDKEECPRTKGVDTMEYRKSDAGLDEYGPGPLH